MLLESVVIPRSWRTKIGVFQLAAIWLVGFVACAVLRPIHVYLSAALWGLLLLGSFVAWGQVFQHVAGDRRRLGWAFDGTVGMAVTLAVFGVLACVRLVSVPAVLIWAAAGPLLEAWLRSRGDAAQATDAAAVRPLWRGLVAGLLTRRPHLVYEAAIALLWTMAALHYCFSVTDATFNVWDDNMAYRSFVQQFLDTGTLYEPFRTGASPLTAAPVCVRRWCSRSAVAIAFISRTTASRSCWRSAC